MKTETQRDRDNPSADWAAESCLLGLMIAEPGRIGRVMERIGESVLFYPAHKTIYRAIVALYISPWRDGRNPVDRFTVLDELKRTGAYAPEVTDAEDAKVSEFYFQRVVDSVPSIANVDYYADLALEYNRDRELRRLGAVIEHGPAARARFGRSAGRQLCAIACASR